MEEVVVMRRGMLGFCCRVCCRVSMCVPVAQDRVS